MVNNTTEMNSKKLQAQEREKYYEEVRRQVVAEAFGPVLDETLSQDTDSDSRSASRNDTDGWPKIWSPISPTKPKFTRLTSPRPKYGIPSDTKYQEPVDLKARSS